MLRIIAISLILSISLSSQTKINISTQTKGTLPVTRVAGASAYKLPNTLTGLNVYGDSITIGFGLTPSTQAWPYLVSTSLNLPISNNFAVSGANTNSVMTQSYPVTTSMSIGSIGLYGANEIGNGGTVAQYENAMVALIAWQGLLPVNKACGTVQCGTAISYSGTWSAFNPNGLSGKFSATVNDTATATVSGTSIYLGYWCGVSFTNTFDVLVDGVSQGPFTEGPCTVTNGVGKRLSGFSAGSHTVVVKVISGGGDATLQWIGGNNGTSFPFVGVGNTLPRTSIPFSTTQSQNTQLTPILANLISDGLNILPVNDFAAFATVSSFPSSFFQADNTHPNATGNAMIASVWLNTIWGQPDVAPNGAGLAAQIVSNPSTNHTVCYRSDKTLGFCSTTVAADGTCTCN